MGDKKDIFKKQDSKIPSLEVILNYLFPENDKKATPISEHSEIDKESKPDSKRYKTNHNLEREMISDPFLSDAVEGYENTTNKDKVKTYLKEINYTISPKDKSDDRKMIAIRIAAILLVLLLISGGALYLFDSISTSPNLADTKIKSEGLPFENQMKDTSTKVASTPMINADTVQQLAIASSTPEKKNSKPTPIENTMATRGIQSESEEIQIEDNLAFDDEEKKADKDNPIEQTLPASSKTNSIAIDDQKEDLKVSRSLSESTNGKGESKKKMKSNADSFGAPNMEVAKTNTLEEGIIQYNQSNFREAKLIFDGMLTNQPSNQEALFYSGMTEYRLGNNELALKKLTKVSNNSRHYDEARWNKAMIYLALGKNGDAKKLLKQLAIPGNGYSEKANEELKKMD